MRHDLQVSPQEIPSHPEEISASFEMRVGRHVTIQSRARITPAGVVCAGIAVAIMTLAASHLVGSIMRRRRD